MSERRRQFANHTDDQTTTKTRSKTQRPKLYRVIVFNDDYTAYEFVVRLMMKTFHRSPIDACDIADSVHIRGQAIAGVYALDIAETKVAESHDWAKQEGHPLVLGTEPDD